MSDFLFRYPDSKQTIAGTDGAEFCLAIVDGVKSLVVQGGAANNFEGTETLYEGKTVKVCPLNHTNAETVRSLFPYTRPSSYKESSPITIGLGDRLGLASPGHIRLIKNLDVFPVLAQQSMRELTLTGRTYGDVLDAATWAVFQENYRKGWGADGDHLKTAVDIQMALDYGYTMITLDCSDHIGTDPAQLLSGEAYMGAIEHTNNIYHELILKCGREIDFELSIDETTCTTSPEAHLFVAKELEKRGVRVTSLAPRFCGEFQKGIDYKGDLEQFKKEFASHVEIAKKFGYKISVHSGSDKFKVFPIVGSETGGVYHLKTAGTNWLEALRVIAAAEPGLFSEIFAFSLDNLSEAKKYYHITEDISKIPPLSDISNKELPELLDQPDARQVLHVTYGLVLMAEKNGIPQFKNRLFTALARNEDDYYAALEKHIGKHLRLLGI